jgi:hypothetical protein
MFPEYCKIIVTTGTCVYFALTNKRQFDHPDRNSTGIITETIPDDIVYYETIYGWGIFVNSDMIVINPQQSLFSDKRIIPVTSIEYDAHYSSQIS